MLNLSGDYPVATASPFKGFPCNIGSSDDEYEYSSSENIVNNQYENKEGYNEKIVGDNNTINNYPTPLPFRFNINLDIKDDNDLNRLEKLIDLYINKLK